MNSANKLQATLMIRIGGGFENTMKKKNIRPQSIPNKH